jgi:hypothetical protein
MRDKSITANEEFQFFKNSTEFIEGNFHEVINQGVGGWLVPSYSGYFDQYISGSAEMHLHIGWLDKRPIWKANASEIGRKDKRDYCIIFEKLTGGVQNLVVGNGFSESTHRKTKGAVLPSTTNSNKLTVLISVFETTDGTQDDIIHQIPKLVRLQLYDDRSCFRMQSLGGCLKTFPQVGIIDHVVTTFIFGKDVLVENWETCVFPALFGDTSNNDIIKCTSQVMYEVTEHNSNHSIRLLSDMEMSPDFILAIRQPDASKLVRVAACIPAGFFLDVYHVFLCPLVFEPPIFVHDVLQYPYGEESEKETN